MREKQCNRCGNWYGSVMFVDSEICKNCAEEIELYEADEPAFDDEWSEYETD